MILQLIFLFFQGDQRQQLLLTSLLGSGRKASVKKSVHASLARQRIVQEERERVVQAYRDIKKRKQQQQQQLKESFLAIDKLKKQAWVGRVVLSFRETRCHYKPIVEWQPSLLSFSFPLRMRVTSNTDKQINSWAIQVYTLRFSEQTKVFKKCFLYPSLLNL